MLQPWIANNSKIITTSFRITLFFFCWLPLLAFNYSLLTVPPSVRLTMSIHLLDFMIFVERFSVFVCSRHVSCRSSAIHDVNLLLNMTDNMTKHHHLMNKNLKFLSNTQSIFTLYPQQWRNCRESRGAHTKNCSLHFSSALLFVRSSLQ